MVKSRVNLHCKDSYFPLKFTKDKPDLRWVLGNMFTVWTRSLKFEDIGKQK